MFQQIVGHLNRIGTVAVKGAEGLQSLGCPTGHDLLEQGDGLAAIRQPQHVADGVGGDRFSTLALNQGLIEKGQRVTHRALGGAGDQGQGVVFDRHALLGRDARQMLDQDLGLDPAQIETLAATEDRHRDLADLGRGQDEFAVGRRLFQRLQQSGEGRG